MLRPSTRHRTAPICRAAYEAWSWGTMAHGYRRNSTDDLFAALTMATLSEAPHPNVTLRRRCVGVLKQIDLHTPDGLAARVVLGNLSAHKS